ncbi:MAG: hypothetical protein AAFV53_08890 [Myxococcota bacterium]
MLWMMAMMSLLGCGKPAPGIVGELDRALIEWSDAESCGDTMSVNDTTTDTLVMAADDQDLVIKMIKTSRDNFNDDIETRIRVIAETPGGVFRKKNEARLRLRRASGGRYVGRASAIVRANPDNIRFDVDFNVPRCP